MTNPDTSTVQKDRERILRRLKKILALTESSSPGEAAAALHQAQKLMQAHGISEDDVEMVEITEASASLTSCDLPKWEALLITVSAQAIGVKAMIASVKPTPGYRRPKATVRFVGAGARPELASYAYDTLRRQLKRDLAATIESIIGEGKRMRINPAWREQYARGWCQEVYQKIASLAGPIPSAKAVDRYIKEKSNGKEASAKSAKKDKSDVPAYFAQLGLKDGKKAQLHKAMGKDEQSAIGLQPS